MIGKLRCFGAAENPTFEVVWVYTNKKTGNIAGLFLCVKNSRMTYEVG